MWISAILELLAKNKKEQLQIQVIVTVYLKMIQTILRPSEKNYQLQMKFRLIRK